MQSSQDSFDSEDDLIPVYEEHSFSLPYETDYKEGFERGFKAFYDAKYPKDNPYYLERHKIKRKGWLAGLNKAASNHWGYDE